MVNSCFIYVTLHRVNFHPIMKPTAACFSSKISENWHLEIKSIGGNRKRFVNIIEDTIQHFPKRVNPFRYIWCHNLLEATDILSENHLSKNIPHLTYSSRGTRVFSNDVREDLLNALTHKRLEGGKFEPPSPSPVVFPKMNLLERAKIPG